MTDIAEIKTDIREIKLDLKEHMQRTAASEARIEIMENFVKESVENTQANFTTMVQVTRDNQAALANQLKIALGVITGLATLVAAFVGVLKYLA